MVATANSPYSPLVSNAIGPAWLICWFDPAFCSQKMRHLCHLELIAVIELVTTVVCTCKAGPDEFSEKKIFYGNVNIRNFLKISKQEFFVAKQDIFSKFQNNRFIH